MPLVPGLPGPVYRQLLSTGLVTYPCPLASSLTRDNKINKHEGYRVYRARESETLGDNEVVDRGSGSLSGWKSPLTLSSGYKVDGLCPIDRSAKFAKTVGVKRRSSYFPTR